MIPIVRSTTSKPNYVRSVLILSSHPRIDLISGLLPAEFPHVFLIAPMSERLAYSFYYFIFLRDPVSVSTTVPCLKIKEFEPMTQVNKSRNTLTLSVYKAI